MAIEDDDIKDREVWTSISRHWYSKTSDKAPTTGRLYHHLAILARPNALRQLFYYTKSLCVPVPFISARESILALFEPQTHGEPHRLAEIDAAFVRAHAILFSGRSDRESMIKATPSTNEFIASLDNHCRRTTRQWIENSHSNGISLRLHHGAEFGVLVGAGGIDTRCPSRKPLDYSRENHIGSIHTPLASPLSHGFHASISEGNFSPWLELFDFALHPTGAWSRIASPEVSEGLDLRSSAWKKQHFLVGKSILPRSLQGDPIALISKFTDQAKRLWMVLGMKHRESSSWLSRSFSSLWFDFPAVYDKKPHKPPSTKSFTGSSRFGTRETSPAPEKQRSQCMKNHGDTPVPFSLSRRSVERAVFYKLCRFLPKISISSAEVLFESSHGTAPRLF